MKKIVVLFSILVIRIGMILNILFDAIVKLEVNGIGKKEDYENVENLFI
jgi:hypothetical protein